MPSLQQSHKQIHTEGATQAKYHRQRRAEWLQESQLRNDNSLRMCKSKGKADTQQRQRRESPSDVKTYEVRCHRSQEISVLQKKITVSGRAEKSIKCPKTKK